MSKRKGICASSIRLEVTIPVRRPNIALSIVRRVPARKESPGGDKSLHALTVVGPDNRNHRVFRARTHAQHDPSGLAMSLGLAITAVLFASTSLFDVSYAHLAGICRQQASSAAHRSPVIFVCRSATWAYLVMTAIGVDARPGELMRATLSEEPLQEIHYSTPLLRFLHISSHRLKNGLASSSSRP